MSGPPSYKQPPFSYASESTEFQRRWFEEVPKRFHALQTQIIPERNILIYQHGRHWTSIDTQENEVTGEFKEHGETLLVGDDDRVNVALEKLTILTDELARKFAANATEMMFQKVEEVTEKTGNVVTWRKKERNAPDVFLELLRKLQFGVTEDGSLMRRATRLRLTCSPCSRSSIVMRGLP